MTFCSKEKNWTRPKFANQKRLNPFLAQIKGKHKLDHRNRCSGCRRRIEIARVFETFEEKRDMNDLKRYDLAPVVQKLDSAIHRINHYPVDKW